MKRRTLFSLALASVLMVGCQQDEFVNVNDTTDLNLGNRPELGSVILNSGDPSTRMTLNTLNGYSFKWEEGDKLGAAIVDMPVETAKRGDDFSDDGGNDYSALEWTYQEYTTGVTKDFTTSGGVTVKVTAIEAGVDIESYYTINNYIASNYPYTLNGGSWTTPANLVEGNYVFYAPYNASHLTRKPIVVTLPMEQDCSTPSNAVSAFYKGTDPVALGNAFLAAPANPADIISPSVKMTNIFAYPQITIKNNFNGYVFKGEPTSEALAKYTMKLKKIEIYTKTSNAPLNYKSALDANTFKAKVAAGWDATKKEDGTGIFTTGVTSEILNAASSYSVANYPAYPTTQTAAKNETGYATEYANSTNDLISDYQVQHITCDLGGKELKNGEEYKFFAVMPAEDYAKGLYAKVYVEIDGDNYIILTSPTDLTITNNKATAPVNTTPLNDYNFSDVKHGDQGVRLVRGQRYPAAEVLEDASAVKDFAGTLMTIDLVGGKRQAAYAMAKVTPQTHNGIRDNADFIDHITRKVQRGVDLIEDNSLDLVDRFTWDAADIAFALDNTVIINAELISALYNRLYDARPGQAATGKVLTLNATKLPIAKDVKVVKKAGTVFTFATLDGKVSYDIDFGTLIGSAGNALVNGINIGNGTLAIAQGTSGAVVILDGDATLDNTNGISTIYVPVTHTLTVNCSTDALIVLQGGSITMGSKGVLTNPKNILTDGTIDNSSLKSISGNTEGATVKATMIGWPAIVISASTKINALSVDLGTKGPLTINTAEVSKLANLLNVSVSLGANVDGIKSSSSVILTNIVSLSATSAIKWSTTANAITVTCGVKDPANNFFTNVTANTGVSFVE